MSDPSRLSASLQRMETNYRALLIRALNDCASGRWGLFGQNEDPTGRYSPPELDQLRNLASEIDRLRSRLALPAYPLNLEFDAAHGRGDDNAVGEPKLA